MTNQEILDNAPEGATHYAGCYFKEVKDGYLYYWHERGWDKEDRLDQYNNVRSLADIRRIVELENQLNQRAIKDGDWIKASDHDKAMSLKDKRIAELEKKEVSLVLNQNGVRQIKADAVRLAIEECAWQGGEICVSDLHLFANKLERGGEV